MAKVLYALGDYRFQAGGGADEIERSSKWRWPSQDVIGARPVVQYTGPGEDTIELSGTIFPEYRGGFGQVDAMRAQAGRGEPMILVDGAGSYLGEYVIEQITETGKYLFADGKPRKIEFKLSLKRFS